MKTINTIKSTVVKARMNAAKSPYFSPANNRFFGTRLASKEAYSVDDRYFWFVTSEQFASDAQRKYTVRVYDNTAKTVETFGDFQAYENVKIAIAVIKDCI